MTDTGIYVRNTSSQVSDADVKTMTLACSKQIALHVAPAYGLIPVQVMFLAKDAPLPSKSARIITVMDNLDDPNALGYHDETAGEHIYGVVGTAVAMKQGAKALTGPYSISSILSHEIIECVIDSRCNLWADNGRGTLIAVEACDPCESDFYLVDGVAVSNFVEPAWFDHLAAKGDRFDYMGKLTKPFTMTRGGYWVSMAGGKVSQKFGVDVPTWRRLSKAAEFSRAHRRATRPGAT